MEIKAIKTRIFRENEDLSLFVFAYLNKLPEKSIVVITSKIVALSEGRTVEYKDEKQKTALIKKESDFAIKTKIVWMTIKDGMVLASAGIDASNANGRLILLPRDSFRTAEVLRKKIMQKFNVKNVGVVITDSRLMPLRSGALGIALGYAGFKGVRNYIGTKDIFARVLKLSKTNIADSLATAAVVCMGEGSEQQPLAVIAGAPVVFANKIKKSEILIAQDKDIYAPFFANLKYAKK